MLILKLFSIGLESAAVSDAVFFKALDLVAKLLPLASPPPPPSTSAAATTSSDSKRKPPPLPLPGKGSSAAGASSSAGSTAVVLPRSALEDVVNQAAIRATRPTRRPRTEAEEEQIKEAFARVFAKSPPAWASKLSECRAKHEEKLSRKTPEVSVSKPISIKGPKREREEAGGGGVGGDGGGGASEAARKRKSRRVDV